MKNDIGVVIPDELKKGMQVLTTIISPVMPNIGILILGNNVRPARKGKFSIVRIYLLQKVEREYHVKEELGAFAFKKSESAISFVEKLPRMTALEMLMMLNGRRQTRSDGDIVYP